MTRILIFLLSISVASAQFPVPDCCTQAISYRNSLTAVSATLALTRDSLLNCRMVLAGTRSLSEELLAEKEARISRVTARNEALNQENSSLKAVAGDQKTKIEALTAENRKLQPRTGIGKLFRKARDSVGPFAVGFTTGIVLLLTLK